MGIKYSSLSERGVGICKQSDLSTKVRMLRNRTRSPGTNQENQSPLVPGKQTPILRQCKKPDLKGLLKHDLQDEFHAVIGSSSQS